MNSIYDNPMTKHINLYLTESLVEIIKYHAEVLGLSEASTIRDMITSWDNEITERMLRIEIRKHLEKESQTSRVEE